MTSSLKYGTTVLTDEAQDRLNNSFKKDFEGDTPGGRGSLILLEDLCLFLIISCILRLYIELIFKLKCISINKILFSFKQVF